MAERETVTHSSADVRRCPQTFGVSEAYLAKAKKSVEFQTHHSNGLSYAHLMPGNTDFEPSSADVRIPVGLPEAATPVRNKLALPGLRQRNLSNPLPRSFLMEKIDAEAVVFNSYPSDDWVVEAIDRSKDGSIISSIFVGPDAEDRALEYAEWKFLEFRRHERVQQPNRQNRNGGSDRARTSPSHGAILRLVK